MSGVTLAARYRAVLTFEEDDGSLAVYLKDIFVAEGEPGSSRLGRDILNQWLTVYDPTGANLFCEPVTTDA